MQRVQQRPQINKKNQISRFIRKLKKDRSYRGQIVYEMTLPAKEPKFGTLKKPLPAKLERKLNTLGLDKLYSHQTEAINLIREGKNVIVVTGTASGKSLCYNLPVLETILKDPKATALYLFPTKALAQDQLRALNQFKGQVLRAATYDGDTPGDERAWVRRQANVVLSNPDMLHFGILPHHPKWGNFLLNLKFVVIDEVHTLRGVFGSNYANVVRRLRRICAHYGSKPQFILSSATIANPKELGEKLLGLDLNVIRDDGAPQMEKVYLLWNPPFLDEKAEARPDEGGVRKSSNSETTYLFLRLAEANLKNIVFSKSRQTAELIYRYALNQIKDQSKVKSHKSKEAQNYHLDSELGTRLASYRAGYLAAERREIEKKLFKGELLGVSSTNALELGIDIGDLEACLINGFPGTIASFFQQAGRSGRTKLKSLAVLVGSDDPLDQYYLKHPQDLFGKPHEKALIDPDNRKIFLSHLACSSYELPLTPDDKKYFKDFKKGREALVKQRELSFHHGKWFFMPPPTGSKFPAQRINIRSASQNTYSIVEAKTGSLLGTVDHETALFYVHPGAIYLHQGDSYLVLELDLAEKIALVKPAESDYYTRPRDLTDIKILKSLKKKSLGNTMVFFGEVEVTTEVIGFQKRIIYGGEILGEETLDLPPQNFQTEAFWFLVPQKIVKELGLNEKELAGGIHAVEHGAIALLPFFAMCDRWDIGGVSTPIHFQTGEPTIFIYDGHEGGVGIAAYGYQLGQKYLKKTWRMIRDCHCDLGCPSCVQSPKCGNFNEPLDKKAALNILKALLK